MTVQPFVATVLLLTRESIEIILWKMKDASEEQKCSCDILALMVLIKILLFFSFFFVVEWYVNAVDYEQRKWDRFSVFPFSFPHLMWHCSKRKRGVGSTVYVSDQTMQTCMWRADLKRSCIVWREDWFCQLRDSTCNKMSWLGWGDVNPFIIFCLFMV